MLEHIKGAIFDLDGVIVDTAKYHYLAWKSIAEEMGFLFSKEANEQLKGVSREKSLDILLHVGGIQCSQAKKTELLQKKNDLYVAYITNLRQTEILPGVEAYIRKIRASGVKTAIGSASRNTNLILEKLNISDLFDAVVDGNMVKNSKPDPEVFLIAAEKLKLEPTQCVVFEDSKAGIEAAKCAGMAAVGIGDKEVLKDADYVISSLHRMCNIETGSDPSMLSKNKIKGE